MNIKSEQLIIDKPVEQIFEFLTDFNNFEKLMPEQVIKWESDEKSCRFTIKDMAEIGMRIENVEANKAIFITSDGKVPFDFNLKVDLDEKAENQTAVQIFFDGKVGAMLAMMAKRPLTNLVNHMVEAIQEHA